MTGILPRATLADRVRDHIVLEITQGRIEPGTPLRELEIAERLGTSQTPVREAFRELIALGLLESRAHVGTRVRVVADRDLQEAVPIRAALEGIAGRLAAERGSDTSSLHDAVGQMVAVAQTGDPLAFATASTLFHRAVIAAADNDALQRSWNALGIEVMTIMCTAAATVPLPQAAESHREVIDAIESGDPDRAQRVLVEHVAAYLPARISS